MIFQQTFKHKFSIVTIIGILFCGIAALIAFERWTEQKAIPVPVDTRTYPNNSSETELKDEFDSPIAVHVGETRGQLIQEMEGSPANNQSVYPLWPKSALNIDQPLWQSSEKYPEKREQSDKYDLPMPSQTFSSAKIESPKRIEDDGDEEASGSQPDEANRFRNLQLQDENGEIPLDGLQNAREQMDLMRDAGQRKAVAEGKPDGLEAASIAPLPWKWLGPGNIGGRIRSIIIDPVDPNKMWVGSVSGGIWKTTNAGGTWSPVNDFMANLAVSTMVIDPANSNIMYAGTGESFAANTVAVEGQFFAPDGLRGAGIFKSSNGGVTWSQLAETNPNNNLICPNPVTPASCPWLYVNRLAISPDSSTILAATTIGIYRSPDGGGTWNRVTMLGTGYLDIDFDPTNSQNAIASPNGGLTPAYSSDGGQSWRGSTFTPAINTNFLSGRVELAYAPSNPLIVYASVEERSVPTNPPTATTFQSTIYKSLDGGQNYTRINMPNSFLGGQGGYDNIIWVNPQDSNFVILGGINLYASTDGGINWNTIADGSNGSAHSDHHMIIAHPGFNNTTNKKVYFSNDGGIYKTDDVSTVSIAGGWTMLNNDLGITQFYSAAANSDKVIVGGTQDNGTLRYSGDAQAWTRMFGGDGGYSAADPTDPNFFYGEYINLGIVRSANGGTSSSYVYCNPAPTDPNGGPCVAPAVGISDAFNGANFIAPFILDPGDSNTLLAGGLSLWRSNDIKAAGLPTWTAIKPPLSNGLIPASIIPISAIAVSPNNSNFIVVGHNNGQIYLTLDGTGTNPPTDGNQCSPGSSPCWSRIDTGLPSRFVTRLVIDETRGPNWIYAIFGGFSNNNVYVTKDFGVTWADVSGVTGSTTDLPSVPVRSLVINPVRPDLIYVGTEVGVFVSEDAGATWRLPQDGPANVSVDELFWLQGSLVAVTHGRGLYKTSNSIYFEPVCVPPANCPCYGQWNCPCTWGGSNAPIPTANDDLFIRCPVHITSNGVAKSIRVQNIFTIDGALTVFEDVVNFGNIRSSSGVSSGLLQCRNFSNTTATHINEGIVSVDVSASGNVTNSGIMAQDRLRILGNLENFGSITAQQSISVGGDVVNIGPPINAVLIAPNLALNGSPNRIRNFSGLGLWRFGTLVVPSGYTLKLRSDLPLDIADINNNGTIDFSDRTLSFRGSSFQGVGTVLGTGILRFAPTSGNSIFYGNGPAVTIASGTVAYQSGGTIDGPLTIDSGATFAMNTSGSLTANSNVTVNGTFSKIGSAPVFNFNGQTFRNNGTVGNINFVNFNSDGGGPPVQFIAGSGSWSPTSIHIGSSGSPTIVNLSNNVTLASSQLITAAGSTLNVSNFTLALTGPTNSFYGKISGTGLVKMQPISGSQRLGNSFSALTIDPAVEIASGTVQASSTIINGKLTVDSGATLSLLDTIGVEPRGDVENNGTINAFSGSPSLKFKGGTFTNNGFVTGNVFVTFGDFFGPPLIQNLGGTGSWAGSSALYFGSTSTTTLLNDFTYNGGNLFVDGRLNTGPFTLSLPCNVPWSGAGDVVGSIRRTNLAACPGAIFSIGNPFTTIQFTSGTPPTEITFNVALNPPNGFSNAVRRTYLITPFGGSNYTATLRLHYLDSELNGNDESTLQLWRNDGSNWSPQGATNRNTTQNWVEYAGVTQFSPWTLSGPLVPTAATVSVGGRVLTSGGRGLRNALVTLADQRGAVRHIITSSFGYYRFDEVEAGQTYIISVRSKSYQFTPRVLSVTEDLTGVDLIALP